MKQRKTFFQKNWQWVLAVFAFVVVGVALAAVLTPSPQSHAHSSAKQSPHVVEVYRPSEKAWLDVTEQDLRPLDIMLKGGQAYHIKSATTSGQAQAVPLGRASRADLESVNGNYDPDNLKYPDHPNNIVYAKWQDTDDWTYQHLGIVPDKGTFLYYGYEFVVHLNTDGTRGVKPTGNVISKVNGVWSEHHDNQIHLTLNYSQTGETAKIITTHEHPFYVPSTQSWVPAADLKVGMDLQTCDGTPSQVAKWEVIDEPFTAYNIEVANSHTYYVSDPNNPNAQPVLVHNDCWDKLPSGSTKLSDMTRFGQEKYKGPNGEDLYKGHDGRIYNASKHPPTNRNDWLASGAEKHGFKPTNYTSDGQKVYRKGNKYIVADVGAGSSTGGHKGGVWKMANSPNGFKKKNSRLGTYDYNLNRIDD